MMDYNSMSSVPYGEDCAQVGSQDYDYYERAKIECRAWKHQLERTFKDKIEQTGIYFKVKGFPHDFGTYYEVVCCYDDSDENQVEACFACEDGGEELEHWDELARKELKESGIDL